MFQSMGPPPSPRFGLTLTVIQQKIYVFGGESVGTKNEDSAHVFILDCCKCIKKAFVIPLTFLLCSQNQIPARTRSFRERNKQH
jgi:hypothetical protein